MSAVLNAALLIPFYRIMRRINATTPKLRLRSRPVAPPSGRCFQTSDHSLSPRLGHCDPQNLPEAIGWWTKTDI